MKVACHLAHPAHYHLFKHVVDALVERHDVLITYNEKDVLEELIRSRPLGQASVKLRSRKTNGPLGLIRQFAQKEVGFFKEIRKYRPDLLLGTSIIVAHVGSLLNIPSIIVNEDDFDVVAGTAAIGYPFASAIVAPNCCRTGRWGHKVIAYDGYHELAYLSPTYFSPEPERSASLGPGPFFLIRFADLSAHHDIGKSGIPNTVARRLIEMLQPYGRVFISSERLLEPEFESFRITLNPHDIHHVLAFATLYIGDSQTMAAEAAVLGTPSLRFNDFVDRISYLDELEYRYGLTFGIPTAEPEQLFEKVNELLNVEGLKQQWQRRRQQMLNEKIDVAAFIVWLIENYPESATLVRNAPTRQHHSLPQTVRQ